MHVCCQHGNPAFYALLLIYDKSIKLWYKSFESDCVNEVWLMLSHKYTYKVLINMQ